MVKRPTIPDLAQAAGVSVSTVNRVLNTPDAVRPPTRERVLRAAQEIGFYGLGTIEHSVVSGRRTHRLGVLLHQRGRRFYDHLGTALKAAAEARADCTVKLELSFLDDLSPETVAARLTALAETCESVALVAAEHPLVSDAIDAALARGVPVVALIAPLSARGPIGFVGLDYRKVGRTAAWAIDRMAKTPGKIGLLLGNHRYRNHELSESGFRSYFREHNGGFTLLEACATYESATVARDVTERLLAKNPDLCGLYISGGGITGALAALRAGPRRSDFVAVGHELFDATRAALIDGTLTLSIAHPIPALAEETVAALVRATQTGPEAGAPRVTLGFEIHTPENV